MPDATMRLIAALAAFGLAAGPAAADRIGTVAAVNETMLGTPPADETRDKLLGDDVVGLERIETTPLGAGQLLFLDGTSLSVAPDSDIVLDAYVYDPDRRAGDVALSITRGALRFIGGRITETGEAIVRTPTATIGIRGSGVIIEVDPTCTVAPLGRAPGCETRITLLSAYQITITAYGDADGDGLDDGPDEGRLALASLALSRPGSVVRVLPDGEIVFDGLVTAEALRELFDRFEGNGDGGRRARFDPELTGRRDLGRPEDEAGLPAGPVVEADEVLADSLDETDILDAGDGDVPPGEGDLAIPDMLPPLDEGPALADLTGFDDIADFTGGVEGQLFDTTVAGGAPRDVAGAFVLRYNFAGRFGNLNVTLDDVDGFDRTLRVDATAVDPALYEGADALEDGGRVEARGRFTERPLDPQPATDGTFLVDEPSLDRRTVGRYGTAIEQPGN
ncbi:MAG: FecR domain-containing protein [Paracoccaceae bacterium]